MATFIHEPLYHFGDRRITWTTAFTPEGLFNHLHSAMIRFTLLPFHNFKCCRNKTHTLCIWFHIGFQVPCQTSNHINIYIFSFTKVLSTKMVLLDKVLMQHNIYDWKLTILRSLHSYLSHDDDACCDMVFFRHKWDITITYFMTKKMCILLED